MGGMIADAFMFRGNTAPEEQFTKIKDLIIAGPLRPYVSRPDSAPVLVPIDETGYFVVICPGCFRSSSVEAQERPTELRELECPFCGAT